MARKPYVFLFGLFTTFDTTVLTTSPDCFLWGACTSVVRASRTTPTSANARQRSITSCANERARAAPEEIITTPLLRRFPGREHSRASCRATIHIRRSRLLERHDHTNEHDRPDRAYRSRAPKQARPMRARLMDDAQHTHPVVALWSSTRTLYVARWRCDARARLACATRLRAHNIPNRAYAPLPHAQQPKMRRICLITSRLISGRAYFGSANVLYD